jgi:hypothetical protein
MLDRFATETAGLATSFPCPTFVSRSWPKPVDSIAPNDQISPRLLGTGEFVFAMHNDDVCADDFAVYAAILGRATVAFANEVYVLFHVRAAEHDRSDVKSLYIRAAEARSSSPQAQTRNWPFCELTAAQIERGRAEATTAATLRSTSWRLTAPIRAVRRFSRNAITLTPLASDAGRWARLQRVAEPGPIRVKGMVRICFYGFSRLAMRQPGSTVMCAVALRLLPRSYKWLRARYHAYLQSAVHPIPHPSPGLASTAGSVRRRSGEDMQPFSLPAEEYQMLKRLRARSATA